MNTVMAAVPPVATSAARILALSCVLLTNVVTRFDPFQRTVDEPLTKPVPATVRVKAAPPAGPDVGLMALTVGTRLLMV